MERIDGLYPVLAWQKEAETTTSLIYLSQSIPVLSLRKGSSIDLSQYYASGHGGILSYSCANSKVKLDGSIISVTEDVEITDLETVTVSVSVSGLKLRRLVFPLYRTSYRLLRQKILFQE